ncbi:protein EMBRYONIC FLOWER 1 isoform X2 [Cornus florida]|uniref:protein EMBRYONIC FLOWER 1 isoform X2 n=1 Tax=Cornus florida TaxID=4283 RepID=UPI0028A2D6AD|nr:protein EMBRYONIC FLOWER 1 isoform X2 [Cornus florida]
MEKSKVVEENHQRSDHSPVSKSLGSLIKIDSISIDLGSAMEKNETEKCEHFSIRGYVAEMRKKDPGICLPFALDGNNKSERQINMLPPLHVAKFRWWRCQNCLQEISTTSSIEEIGVVPNCCKSGVISSSTCSHMQYHDNAAMVLSDVQQASKLDFCEGRKADASTSTKVFSDEYCFSSCSDKMEAENGQTAVTGHRDDSQDYRNQEIHNPTCDATNSNPGLIQERDTVDTVAFKSKGSELVESCEPNCGSHEVAVIVPATGNVKCDGGSSAEICQMGKLSFANDQQRSVPMTCETEQVVGKIDQTIDAVTCQTTRITSLELEEHDNASYESDEILGENLIRRKTRKVRLLTELLGAKGNAETYSIRKEGASSNAMPNTSNGLGSWSAPQFDVTVGGNIGKGFGGPNKKRKMRRGKDWKPLEMSCPDNVTKKVRVFKGDRETSDTSIEIAGSESEGDAAAGVGVQTDLKSHWTKYRIDRNPTQFKKKNKEPQVSDGYPPLVPWQSVMPEYNQIKIGDAAKCGVAANTGLMKSAHDSFTRRGPQQCFRSYLSPLQAEKNLGLYKKKNKMPQVEDGWVSLMPKRSSMPEEDSVIRNDVKVMQSGPEGVKFHSTHDASARKGLDFPLNSYMAAQRSGLNYFALSEDGNDPLFPQKKVIPREEHRMRKDVRHAGEKNVPPKSATDPSFGEGLFCDLNERITQRASFLREMQNCSSLVEDGSYSLHQKLDTSGPCNKEKTTEVQEHSEVVKRHSDQRADKLYEQGTLDDIPMDIVELMAKNQYERLHEAERSHCLSERIGDKRNTQIMGLPEAHGNGVLKLLHEENPRTRKPQLGNGRNGVIRAGKSMGPTMQNPVNYFSSFNRNHFNMGKQEKNPAFTGFSTFSQHQEKPSGGVQFPISGSVRNSSSQNCKWNVDNVVPRSSPTNMQVLEFCDISQNGSRQHEEAEHVRSSMIPNHVPFGLNIPQSSNLERHSQCPVTLSKGKMIGDLDMNCFNPSATSLDKQNRNLDSESFGRMPAKYPFVCKHGGVEHNKKGTRSLDLYPNETIPAMQLLSLMDAGMQSSTPFSLDDMPEFFNKPFFPCDHHPKVGVDGKSKFLDKAFFPCDHSKEFSALGRRVYKACDSSRHPSSVFYGLVSPKSLEQGKKKGSYSSTQNRGRKPQKYVCRTGVAGTSHASNPVLDKQKVVLGVSESLVFPFQCHTVEESSKRMDLVAHAANGNTWCMKSISNVDICTVNRNPADFSIPEAGNVYMISGEDLKFRKRIPSMDRSGLFNVDGRKRQRVTKRTAIKERLNHVS